MTVSMTERDKKLLMLVGCAVVVAVCLQYLILPALESRQELELELEAAMIQQQQWEQQLLVLDYIDGAIADNEESRRAGSAPYYGALETREMDDIITGLALSHELFPQALTLTEAVPGAVPDYLGAPPDSQETAVQGYVYIGRASLEVQGSEDSWRQLLDDVLENYPGLRITAFEIEEVTYIEGSSRTVNTNRITCAMDIYMCIAGGEGIA